MPQPQPRWSIYHALDMPKSKKKISPGKYPKSKIKICFLAAPVDRPRPPVDWWCCFSEFSFPPFSVFVHRNRVNLILIFHNFSSPFQRQYPLAKTTSGSKRTSGNPRAELEYLPVFRESPSGLRIGRFLNQTCLEFFVLRRSKAGF